MSIVSAHIIFIFLHINIYSRIIKLSYQKQKNEQLKTALEYKKQNLAQQLCALKNQALIKEFAKNSLRLEPITLKQVRKMNR